MTFLNFNTITLWKKYKLFEIHPNTNTNQYFNIKYEYNFSLWSQYYLGCPIIIKGCWIPSILWVSQSYLFVFLKKCKIFILMLWSFTLDFTSSLLNLFLCTYPPRKIKKFVTVSKLENSLLQDHLHNSCLSPDCTRVRWPS